MVWMRVTLILAEDDTKGLPEGLCEPSAQMRQPTSLIPLGRVGSL